MSANDADSNPSSPSGDGVLVCQQCQTSLDAGQAYCPSCGTPSGAIGWTPGGLDLAVGDRVNGRFELVELLGRGGFGSVFKVVDLNHQVVKALKIPHANLAQDPEFRQRFDREIRILLRLNHQNIVPIRDTGITPTGLPFYTMDFCGGRTLRHVIRTDGPIAVPRFLKIAGDILAALHSAHVQGVLHRDLKPVNIILIEEGGRERARVLDFGIGKILDRDDPDQTFVTQRSGLMGTPAYMPPEQIEGETLDARSDVYSAGATFYETLAGRPLFVGRSMIKILDQARNDRPTPLSEVRPGEIPEWLDAAVLRSLEKSASDRFSTADDFRRALEEARPDLPTQPLFDPTQLPPQDDTVVAYFGDEVEDPTLATVSRTPRTRRWWPLALLILVSVSIALYYFLIYLPGSTPPRITPPITLALESNDLPSVVESRDPIVASVTGPPGQRLAGSVTWQPRGDAERELEWPDILLSERKTAITLAGLLGDVPEPEGVCRFRLGEGATVLQGQVTIDVEAPRLRVDGRLVDGNATTEWPSTTRAFELEIEDAALTGVSVQEDEQSVRELEVAEGVFQRSLQRGGPSDDEAIVVSESARSVTIWARDALGRESRYTFVEPAAPPRDPIVVTRSSVASEDLPVFIADADHVLARVSGDAERDLMAVRWLGPDETTHEQALAVTAGESLSLATLVGEAPASGKYRIELSHDRLAAQDPFWIVLDTAGPRAWIGERELTEARASFTCGQEVRLRFTDDDEIASVQIDGEERLATDGELRLAPPGSAPFEIELRLVDRAGNKSRFAMEVQPDLAPPTAGWTDGPGTLVRIGGAWFWQGEIELSDQSGIDLESLVLEPAEASREEISDTGKARYRIRVPWPSAGQLLNVSLSVADVHGARMADPSRRSWEVVFTDERAGYCEFRAEPGTSGRRGFFVEQASGTTAWWLPKGLTRVAEEERPVFRSARDAVDMVFVPGLRDGSVDPFLIDRYEVSNERFAAQRAQHRATPPDRPVVRLSWLDARDFAEKVGKRLPQKSEWEVAGYRSSDRERRLRYPWGDVFDAGGITRRRDLPAVDANPKDVSSWGVIGMAGSVREWLEDGEGDFHQVIGGHYQLGAFDKDPYQGALSVLERSGGPEIGFRCLVRLEPAQ